MKRFTSFGCLMMFFLLLTPLPARAEMTVTIVNGSSLEINYLYLDSGEGGMGSSMSLVPGNRINMNDGNASILKGLTVFAGTKRYVFESMSLPGPKQGPALLSCTMTGVPAAFPEGESQSSGQGESLMLKLVPSGTTMMLRNAVLKCWQPGWKPIPQGGRMDRQLDDDC